MDRPAASRVRARIAPYVICGLLLARAAPASQAAPAPCTQSWESYAAAGYRVAHVRPESPFDYLPFIKNGINDALGVTRVKPGDSFRPSGVSHDRRAIRARLQKDVGVVDLPITVSVVVATVENCKDHDVPPTLDVVYHVFTTRWPFQANWEFEGRAVETSEPARGAGMDRRSWHVVPVAAFEPAAGPTGGLRVSGATPIGSLEVEGSSSKSAGFATATYSGTQTFDRAWIQRIEWKNGYVYSNSPLSSGSIEDSLASTQLVAASRPLGDLGVVLRFGGGLAAGQQSSTVDSPVQPDTPLNNPSTDVSGYAGVTFRTGRHAFEGSYGLRVGGVGRGAQLGFAKQFADAAYDVSWLVGDHRPIELGTRLAVGFIRNLGAIPLAERFFGGSHAQNVLLGDSWQINSAPFIRSIPRNALDHLSPTEAIGGERFVSANVTLGVTTWHRALVPADLRKEQTFQPLLAGQLRSAGRTLNQYWRSKEPAVADALAAASGLSLAIDELRRRFDQIGSAVPEALADRYGDCDIEIVLAEGLRDNLVKETNVSKQFISVSSFAVLEADAGSSEPDGSIEHLRTCVTDLRNVLGPDLADEMLATLERINGDIRAALARTDTPTAKAQADRDMGFITRTINTLLDEVNLFSVSPIAVFDIARIGPQVDSSGGGFRYGIGGGVRLAVVNTVRVTAGYAVNPNRKPWEARGAPFLSVEITSPFH